MADELPCAICKGLIEQARPGKRICYGCHLDSLIPYGYEGKEQYVFDSAWGRENATKHPKTGVLILDDNRPRLHEIAERIGVGRLSAGATLR